MSDLLRPVVHKTWSACMQLFRYEYYMTDRGLTVSYSTHEIRKVTPKGMWIDDPRHFGKRRWVPKEGKNLYAFRTKQAAWLNFLARKKKQLGHLQRQVKALEGLLRSVNHQQPLDKAGRDIYIHQISLILDI